MDCSLVLTTFRFGVLFRLFFDQLCDALLGRIQPLRLLARWISDFEGDLAGLTSEARRIGRLEKI